ncbi:MAG: tyrosine/phenylalanine carboxypeptidase domain-containing protein [Candidatus Peribacteraceae bacterium]|jgi:alpha-L-glutamate ligase-like protein/uncharacterized protein (TIGR02421 family)
MFPIVKHGILGLNARNLLYLKPFNPQRAVALADSKLKTKAFLSARGIPVAKVYGRIENRWQLRAFDFASLPDECVLKPNFGYGGEGILILKGRRKGRFLEEGRVEVSEERLREHIENILEGQFSVNGRADTAFFERILAPHQAFAPFRPAGLPDIRIVVFNLVPVMAMLRVPTTESGGKANVHQGGIGIGIDIAKGVTTHAVQGNRHLAQLPHGGSPAGIAIPFWEEMLLLASRIQTITNIGYLAVDFTLDREQGVTLLEVNARAGLMLQVANLSPLRRRLERVKGLKISAPEKGVRVAQDLFGHKVHPKAREPVLDRPRLGVQETLTIHGQGVRIEIPAIIAPAVTEHSVFRQDLIEELRKAGGATEEEKGEDRTYRVKFTLGGRKISTLVHVGSVPGSEARAVIGRRDLQGYYIDPTKKHPLVPAHTRVTVNLRPVDRTLSEIDEQLLLLKYLKPINLPEERERLENDDSHSPLFLYPDLPVDLDAVEERLLKVTCDETPLGELLAKKRRELLLRVALIRTRGDTPRFTAASQALFGAPHADILGAAQHFLRTRIASDLPPPKSQMLTAERAAEVFEWELKKYGLHEWQVLVRAALVADCTVGWRRLYLREGALFSEEHVRSLVAHEIETHILTSENGSQQPYTLFRRGFANYLDTQEGLAVFNQNRILSPHHEKRNGPARSVLAVAYAKEHSFVDTRRHLQEELGYRPAKALTKAIELKRGLHDTAEPGCFTKSLVYFRGWHAVERFAQEGGDLKRLYIGKIALEDLELAEKVEGVVPPGLVPDFLRQ